MRMMRKALQDVRKFHSYGVKPVHQFGGEEKHCTSFQIDVRQEERKKIVHCMHAWMMDEVRE